MISNKKIMEEARETLKGNWGKSVGFTVIIGAILIASSLIFSADNFIKIPSQEELATNGFEPYSIGLFVKYFALGMLLAVINMIICYTVGVGNCYVYLDLVKTKIFNWGAFKHCLHKIFRNALSCFLANTIMTLAIAIFAGITAGAAFVIGFLLNIAMDESSIGSVLLPIILVVVWCIAIAIILYKWLPVTILLSYKLASDSKVGAVAAIKETFNLVSPHNKQLWGLGTRFTGWILLCVVTLGIAALWVIPYMAASLTLFYNAINGNSIPEEQELSEETSLVENVF